MRRPSGVFSINKLFLDLNRDWTDNPKSPEIKVIKKQIHKYGCDLFFDLHGDEGVKKHFLVNPPENQHILHNTINRSINQKDKDFTPKCRYPKTWTTKKMGTADDYWGGITVEGAMKHKLYGKYLKTSVKYLADDPRNECNIGDTVLIEECRPLSKRKRWRVKQILVQAV